MPLRAEGVSKSKAFLYGTLSGIVEPIGAAITILLTNAVVPILPYLLSFAAGAMIYVVVEELIPESRGRRAFKHWDNRCKYRICCYDDIRCSIRIKESHTIGR